VLLVRTQRGVGTRPGGALHFQYEGQVKKVSNSSGGFQNADGDHEFLGKRTRHRFERSLLYCRPIEAWSDQRRTSSEAYWISDEQIETSSGQNDIVDGAIEISNEAFEIWNGANEISNDPKRISNGAKRVTGGPREGSIEVIEISNGPNEAFGALVVISNALFEISNGSFEISNGSNEISNGSFEIQNGAFHDGLGMRRVSESSLAIGTCRDGRARPWRYLRPADIFAQMIALPATPAGPMPLVPSRGPEESN